ncbi:MAG: AI-2E family transporter [Candidatus Limnocylindrales bacterium]
MPVELSERQRRLLDAALVLAVVALAFVVVADVAGVLTLFSDVLLVFFLAWLLAFAVLPLINLVKRLVPGLPDIAAVLLVFLVVVGLLLALLIQVSSVLASSIGALPKDQPLYDQFVKLLAGVQGRLVGVGFKVDLVGQAPAIWDTLNQWAVQLVGPLQQMAVASIGVIGNVLIITILSVYLVIDREEALAFVYRLVPPGRTQTARLVQTSVARSFGGFLRTQLVMGMVFGVLAAIVNAAFGLPYSSVTSVAAGVLHAIPFFGPFVSWLPPVAVALLSTQFPTPVIVLAVMGVGWFATMNILQPRLMAGAVGIHPIVVLGSVVVGSKLAGIPGAIFGIPIAAVLSAFFFHWFERSREGGTVADRATKRLEAREGHPVRRPQEPVPGLDEDVDEVRRRHQGQDKEPVAPEADDPIIAAAAGIAASVTPPRTPGD